MADEEYYTTDELNAMLAERARLRELGLLDAKETVFDVLTRHAVDDPNAHVVKSSNRSFIIGAARPPRPSED